MSERAAKVLKIAIGAVIVAGVVAGAVVFVCKARATVSDFADKCKAKKQKLHDKYLEAFGKCCADEEEEDI